MGGLPNIVGGLGTFLIFHEISRKSDFYLIKTTHDDKHRGWSPRGWSGTFLIFHEISRKIDFYLITTTHDVLIVGGPRLFWQRISISYVYVTVNKFDI